MNIESSVTGMSNFGLQNFILIRCELKKLIYMYIMSLIYYF